MSIEGFHSQLVLRSLSRHITRRYGVVLPHRDLIVQSVIATLSDATPMHVVRTDISSFYESIPLQPLRRLLYNSALPRIARSYLRAYFDKFCPPTATDCGLPRGIGLSAVLAEFSMQDFDRKVCETTRVFKYFRFSDDIILFSTDEPTDILSQLCPLWWWRWPLGWWRRDAR